MPLGLRSQAEKIEGEADLHQPDELARGSSNEASAKPERWSEHEDPVPPRSLLKSFGDSPDTTFGDQDNEKDETGEEHHRRGDHVDSPGKSWGNIIWTAVRSCPAAELVSGQVVTPISSPTVVASGSSSR